MTIADTYTKSDFEFDFFMATVGPSQFSEFEWRLFQAFRRNTPQRWAVQDSRIAVMVEKKRENK